MAGSLGAKIGEGVFADVHAWAPGQVVKLFKAGAAQRSGRWEARMTRAIFAAGGPAPEVLGEVTIEGRFGIVLPRLDGPTLVQITRSGALSPQAAGAILAGLAIAVHATPPPAEVPSLYDYMYGSLRGSGEAVPERLHAGVLALIARLPPGEGLCHLDLHSGNVIVTDARPQLIDWLGAVRGPAALDLAVCQVLHCEIAAETVDDPQRPLAVNAALQAEYALLAGAAPAALAAAMAPYLPIVRVLVLLGGGAPTLRARLIARVEADLRGEG